MESTESNFKVFSNKYKESPIQLIQLRDEIREVPTSSSTAPPHTTTTTTTTTTTVAPTTVTTTTTTTSVPLLLSTSPLPNDISTQIFLTPPSSAMPNTIQPKRAFVKGMLK